MNVWHFLRDRLPVLFLYTGMCLTVVAVVFLGLVTAEGMLSRGHVLYLFILQGFFFIVYLLVDYARHLPLYRQFKASDPEKTDDALRIAEPVTAEEKELVRRLHALHRVCSTRLLQHRREHERHLEYVRMWGHQMKTPASVIHLLLQEAKAQDGRTDAKWVASMEEEMERIAEGLDMMLSAARLSRMENDLHIRKIDLAGLLRQCINERKTAFIRNGVFPKLQVETSKTHVESDEKWLRFTVHQLISNALKYTKSENGKSHLVLSVRSERQTVLLEIRDDGIGIPPEDLPRIFEPFFTGENGRRTKEASGMGLYLVKQALNRLGHRIEAHSRPGEGTRFVIRFAGSSITRLEDDTMNLAKL